jgi:phosphoenolpyruvate carboxykinase (ATP)
MKKEQLQALGITSTGDLHWNLTVPQLVEAALRRGEGVLSNTGALTVETGKYTGRSPKDKFIVDEPSIHDEIAWGSVNKPISQEKFNGLYGKLMAYLQNRELFVFEGFLGKDPAHRIGLRVINEYAWQNIFVHQLFVRPEEGELDNYKEDFTIICAPGFKADPKVDGTNSEAFILVSFEKKVVIIGGSSYAGEMKKSAFSLMNYILPKRGVMPMHCSANVDDEGNSALFFGLSGTGKTTLSADPSRKLIGDDEHGWSDEGIFNFEGGCYAKTINLDPEHEPEIWGAIRFGSVMENVVLRSNRTADFDDSSRTENTRVAYPVDYISNAELSGKAGHPKVVIFLTADAFGVLPPIARLTPQQAMYHFISGYTSKLAGTERGITEPEATFSSCFGAPFLPLAPQVYAKMLGEHIATHNARVYLINTGWSGGPYGVGKRISLPYTRRLVQAALTGEIEKSEFQADPIFGIDVPKTCQGVPSELLWSKNTWQDKEAYDRQAKYLAQRFIENMDKLADVVAEIKAAGPKIK